MNSIDLAALADFLRRSRQRIDPSSVGLSPRARMRTPGLRREDVAQMAGISVDYYARLEQRRGARPSEQVIGALARALRLTEDECDYLHRLAGYPTRTRGAARRHVSPGLLLILDRLVDAPAQVISDTGQVLARNAMAEALLGAPVLPGRAGNAIWRMFTETQPRLIIKEQLPRLMANHVADLRATHARRPDDAEVNELISDLLKASAAFRELWERHDVAVMRGTTKTFVHPHIGEITLQCETLLSASTSGEQSLVLYTAEPGTDNVGKLELLRVLGQESFAEGNVR
ncbi:MAG TPA: helix-turn-helix transcriptional regulator [Actinocrinis sp.]|uniref:helix-turn-helix transcriptional regulator n=1 Tax=Actinocrinis sp. TaxID=1920516 RepID=UPI002D5D3D14|nr:helix-turn-helix transcriptional regulator [Actinocrinis sp.]HZU55624.1 helix-turn-helix transcriptional regulator [Actinocrinis sp.]